MADGDRNRTRILYCIDGLALGGTELQLVGLIDRLDRTEFEPILCTLKSNPPKSLPTDCRHLELDVRRIFSPKGAGEILRLTRFLRREDVAVIQTFFQDATIVGGVAARLAGTPLRLASFRDLGFWRTATQDFLMRRIYPMMNGYLANSQCVKEHFVDKSGVPAGRIQVIYNGVDQTDLPFVEHQGPTVAVGIVGNMNRRVKRTDLFIEAAVEVAQTHPGITWHVIGDGKFAGELKELAQLGGLGDRIVFTGRIADVSSYLANLQVGVLCSDTEGFSNALLEYMFRGCAVVATDVGGNSEALEHGRTGLLVPAGDRESLVAAIRMLVEDVTERKRLAVNARAFAEENFSWGRCVAAHEAVYRKSTGE